MPGGLGELAVRLRKALLRAAPGHSCKVRVHEIFGGWDTDLSGQERVPGEVWQEVQHMPRMACGPVV